MSSAEDIEACGLVVRPHEHLVVVHGRELDLTSREFEIVLRLAEHPGWVFTAEQLSTENEDSDYSPESVSVLISRLRRKLAHAGAPECIETVRGSGYRLHIPRPEGEEPFEPAPGVHNALRDAVWRLQEAVLEVEHSGSEEQRRAAVEALERARRAIYAALAE